MNQGVVLPAALLALAGPYGEGPRSCDCTEVEADAKTALAALRRIPGIQSLGQFSAVQRDNTPTGCVPFWNGTPDTIVFSEKALPISYSSMLM